MNIASIDIGSNTVLLLIAEINPTSPEIKTILNKYEAPRLGRGLKKDGNISDDSIKKLLDVLSSYKKIIDEYSCETVLCTATNAMRVAKNSEEIIKKVKSDFDIDIEIIPGEREAELSFLGASSSIPEVKRKIVVDIGGGSTEIIFGENEEIIFKKSYPVGAVNTTETFIHQQPPNENEIKELKIYVQNTFAELKEILPKGMPLIAVAGTPTSLSAINLKLTEYVDDKVEGSRLSLEDIDYLISEFSFLTPEEILDKYDKIIKGREDVILAGTIILKTVCELSGNSEITVSGRGIRYGLIVDYLNQSIGKKE